MFTDFIVEYLNLFMGAIEQPLQLAGVPFLDAISLYPKIREHPFNPFNPCSFLIKAISK